MTSLSGLHARVFYSSASTVSVIQVTYLSGRKQFRGCIAVVKISDVTLPKKNGLHEFWIFVRLPPYFIKIFCHSYLHLYSKIAKFSTSCIFCLCRLTCYVKGAEYIFLEKFLFFVFFINYGYILSYGAIILN